MKSRLILLCLFLPLFTKAQQKLEFEKMSPMLNEGFAFGYAESDQDIFALTGGDDFMNYNSFLQTYDTRLDLWIAQEIKGLPIIKYASAAYLKTYNGLLLLGGTRPFGRDIAKVEKIRLLSLDDFSITVLGNLPEPARRMGLAMDGNKAYFFGGSTGMSTGSLGTRYFNGSNKFFVYDLEVGHLEMLPDLPKAMETDGGIVDGNLYVFGGFDGAPLSGIWKYNIEQRLWQELAPFARSVSSYALTQYKHYFILVGDFYNGNQLIVYDTQMESAEYFKMNFSGSQMGASVVGDHLYVYGGKVPPPNPLIRSDLYRISLSELFKSKEQ